MKRRSRPLKCQRAEYRWRWKWKWVRQGLVCLPSNSMCSKPGWVGMCFNTSLTNIEVLADSHHSSWSMASFHYLFWISIQDSSDSSVISTFYSPQNQPHNQWILHAHQTPWWQSCHCWTTPKKWWYDHHLSSCYFLVWKWLTCNRGFHLWPLPHIKENLFYITYL